MIKEEEKQEKKGWFGRRKKKSSGTPQSVSRPPSAASFGLPKKRTSQETNIPDDDELPPREGASTPTPAPASSIPPKSPSTPNSGDVGTSDIPVHAGFDFAAIKQVLGKSDLNPGELKIPQASPFPPPSIHPPTKRTESAPPPIPEPPSPPTPKARASADLPPILHDEEPIAGPSASPRSDLSSAFSRSLSLNNMSDAGEADMTSFGSAVSSSRRPTLAFGGSDGSLWPAQDPEPISTAYGAIGGYQMPSSLSAMRSADLLSNPFASAGSGGLRPDGLPAPPDNPFASSPASGLSFGGIDGSITFSSASSPPPQASGDPWGIGSPYGSGKKATSSTLDLNPWQS